SAGQHCSVLRGVSETEVVIHDPAGRPDRRLRREYFLALWEPSAVGFRRTGHALIVVGRAGSPAGIEGAAIPEAVTCPACSWSICLKPWRGLFTRPDRQELICPGCEAAVRDLTGGSSPLPLNPSGVLPDAFP